MRHSSVVRRSVAGMLRATVAAVVLFGGLSAPTDGQVRVQSKRWTRATSQGWIGISFDPGDDRWDRSTRLLITEVSPGSPAEHAGIRAGDRLLAINELHTADELESLAERLHLRVGDPVLIEVERDGRRHRLQLVAELLPESVVTGRTIELSFGTDSMVESWVQAMDSLRVEIVTGGGRNVLIQESLRSRRRIQEAPPSVGRIQEAPPRAGQIRVVTGGSGERTAVRAPFEFFVFRGEAHDSLREEMGELNRIMAELDVRLQERERELRGIGRRDGDLRVREDREARGLRAALDAATVRSASLETAMAEAARATAGLEYARSAPGVGSSLEPSVPDRGEFRPLTPYLLGRNRVAGAQLVDVKPEMAPYFQVQGGVLVTDVAPGTPASMAGLVPGDVITHLDKVVIRSVEDLRFGVSQADETLPITLVRQGARVQVLLRR